MSEVRFCPSCGTARQPGDAFCRGCGRHLTEDDELEPGSETPTGADPGPAASTVPASSAPAPPPAAIPSPPPSAVTQPLTPVAPPGYVVVPVSQPTTRPAAAVPPAVPAAPASTSGRAVAGLKWPVRPLALVGATAVVVGVFLPWVSSQFGGGNAFDVPLAFLWSLDTSTGIKLGVVLLLVGAGAAVLTFLPGTGPIRRILGLVAALAAVAYSIQVFRAIDRAGGGVGDAMDAIGVAVYVTLVGGILLASSR